MIRIVRFPTEVGGSLKVEVPNIAKLKFLSNTNQLINQCKK